LLLVGRERIGDFGSGAQSKREMSAELASVWRFRRAQQRQVGLICSPTRLNCMCRRAKAAAMCFARP